jgi:hypothetical protein
MNTRGMSLRFIAILAASAFVIISMQSCASVVQKQLVPTGGSRADGTVQLSYEFNRREIPRVDNIQGLKAAEQRCASWGYTGAEPYGGSKRTCNAWSSDGCYNWMVTVDYQCIGTGTPSASK